MNNTISIIIPVYQAKQYLKKCIDSVLAQTYKDIELVLVDDGATDGSADICDEISRLYSQVKVIHQENSGVSSARNTGINQSTGRYIMFIDADDYISSTLCENLIKSTSDDIDIVVSGLIKVDGTHQIPTSVERTVILTLAGLKNNFDYYYKLLLLNSPVARLYKRDILGNIRFDTNITMGEDFLFNLKYFERCAKILFLPNTEYYYNQKNIGSATKNYREDYFNCIQQNYVAGKLFKYGKVEFFNDQLDETFCANCLNLMWLAYSSNMTKNNKLKKIKSICTNEMFMKACFGNYSSLPLRTKIPMFFCRKQNFMLLKMFFTLKGIIKKVIK